MKKSILLISLLAAVPAFHAAPAKETSSAASPSDSAPKARPVALQVVVSMPPSMRPWLDDDIAEAFADRISSALHEQGLRGEIAYVTSFDHPASDRPLLSVNLIEWRRDRVGMVDCTFSAELSSPKGHENLGLFTGTGLAMFSRRDWFGRAEPYEDAARDALSHLYQRIAATHLLPGEPTVSA